MTGFDMVTLAQIHIEIVDKCLHRRYVNDVMDVADVIGILVEQPLGFTMIRKPHTFDRFSDRRSWRGVQVNVRGGLCDLPDGIGPEYNFICQN
jgi:hypothetical protein